MKNEFRKVAVINKETEKSEDLVVGSDGKYYSEDGSVYEQSEINNSENIVIQLPTSEELRKQEIEDAFDDRPSINTPIPIHRSRPDPDGEWMKNHNDRSISMFSNEDPSTNINGEASTVRHDFVVAKDNVPGENSLLHGETHDEGILYRRTSTVNFPSDSPWNLYQCSQKIGSSRSPRLSLPNSSFYTGHIYLLEVCCKSKFLEQCINLGVGGEGTEHGKDGSVSLNYSIANISSWRLGIGGTTTFTGEASDALDAEINLATKEIVEELQEIKQIKEEKSQEIKKTWESLNTPKGAMWFLERLSRY